MLICITGVITICLTKGFKSYKFCSALRFMGTGRALKKSVMLDSNEYLGSYLTMSEMRAVRDNLTCMLTKTTDRPLCCS